MRFSQHSSVAFAAAVVAGVLSSQASAAFVAGDALIDPALPGTTQFDGWKGLTSVNYPGYPAVFGSVNPWPQPIGSNIAGSGDADLNKIGNNATNAFGPYPAGQGLYFLSFSNEPNTKGGTLRVSDATPVAGVKNITLQIEVGAANGYDLWDGDNDGFGDAPVLSYNNGAGTVPSVYGVVVAHTYSSTVTMPTGPGGADQDEDIYVDTWLYQYDLSSVGVEITSFALDFSVVEHGQVYALRLDQSDQFALVPEPTALSLVGLAGAALLRRRRA